ncbi:hypothetical protein Q8W42_05250 [Vibrio splendidus]|uniref:Uncharacterized protein n=1 Tax=Vibrio splendidus TaxID=29497 RepID=A0AB35MV83_VIBSP|nr:hypothetical protein [Vibrio splendidus]MDP2500112.1 hypothetical protein [Vibrio splendidus]
MYNPKDLDEYQKLANRIYESAKKLRNIHSKLDSDRFDATLDKLRNDIGVRHFLLTSKPGLSISEWENLKEVLYKSIHERDCEASLRNAILKSPYLSSKLQEVLYLWIADYRSTPIRLLGSKEKLSEDEELNLSLTLNYEPMGLAPFIYIFFDQ